MMTEELWNIPASWEWTKLSCLGDIVGGGTPSTKEQKYWGDDVNWISPADLTGYTSKTIARGAKGLTRAGLDHSSAKVMPRDSVHFSSRAPIGYVAISSAPLATNQGFKSLVPAEGIFNEFVYYYLKSATDLARERASGTTFLELSGTAFGALPIPIAPTHEQRRIVSKLEELFSELDKGIESLTTAREQLKAYRQSVLKHAFEGRLTERWREKHARNAGTTRELEAALRSKRITDDELDGKPELPEGWAYFRVASLCSVVRGGSPRPAGDPKYYGGSVPFLKVADLTHTSGIHLATYTFTITEAGLSKTRMTPPNTLLISNSGATLGVPKICTFETTFNDGIAAFLGLPDGYLEYFYFFWESKTTELRNIDQGAAQPNLNTSLLGEMLVPMCLKEEACEIVKFLEATLSTIEHVSADIDARLQQSSALRQSIFKQAFAGQLVAQEPKDEPASALLARIRAEREAAPTKKTRNGDKNSKNGKKNAS